MNVHNGKKENEEEYQEAIDTRTALVPEKGLVRLRSATNTIYDKPVFFVHPIEGYVTSMRHVAAKLAAPVWGLQCTADAPVTSIPELASFYIQRLKKVQSSGAYTVMGYSFGAAIAFEIGLQLEKINDKASLVLIDGAPSCISTYANICRLTTDKEEFNITDDDEALTYFGSLHGDFDLTNTVEILLDLPDFESRLDYIAEILSVIIDHEAEEIKSAGRSFCNLLKAGDEYKPKTKFNGKVTLIRCEDKMFESLGLEEDYGLSKICQQKVNLINISGSSRNFIKEKSPKIAEVVNKLLS